LLEPAVRAYEKLEAYEVNGVTMNPDSYYQMILDITNDEKKARNAQASLMLQQMPD
jgi:hypothetical protein